MTKITVKESELRSLVKGVVGKQVNEWRSRDSNADAWADLETNGAASQQRQKVKDMYAKKRDQSIDQSIDNSHVPEYYSTYENGYIANINGYTQNQIDAMNDRSRSGMERSIRNNFDNEDYFNESKVRNIIKKVIKESVKKPLKEGVARNIPKIEKYVNQINELIAQAVDTDGDKIGVIWPNGTWDEPFTYDPIIYRNGSLKIVSYSPHSNHGKPNVDIVRSRDMELDGIPTLQLISRMFKKAIKNKDNYSNSNPDMNECKIDEGFEELIPIAAGTAGVFLASAGISEVLNALKQGKLGEKGQKLAKFLEDLSRTANKQEPYTNR